MGSSVDGIVGVCKWRVAAGGRQPPEPDCDAMSNRIAGTPASQMRMGTLFRCYCPAQLVESPSIFKSLILLSSDILMTDKVSYIRRKVAFPICFTTAFFSRSKALVMNGSGLETSSVRKENYTGSMT